MKIGVLLFYDKINRGTRDNSFQKLPYYGFNYILSELNYKYDFINITELGKYDYVLCSLTSVMDVENMIYIFEEYRPDRGQCKIVIGGAGCVNIWSLYDYIDIAVFGRAEGQINDILKGSRFDNVWRKDDDPDICGKYNYRQSQFLIGDEIMVGCRNKCYFCQYSNTHKYYGSGNYDPVNAPFPEDDWRGLRIEGSKRYLTAWDGLSEETRLRVNKKITDQDIIEKLKSFYMVEREAAINLKIYNIIGYPWETLDTVNNDLNNISKMLKKCDKKRGGKNNRVFIMMMFTPFSPEPLTPMELQPANININWGKYFRHRGRNVYNGIDFEMMILPQINAPFTLAKRVMINRANAINKKQIQTILKSKKINSLSSGFQMAALNNYKGFDLSIFDKQKEKPCNYLETYFRYKHL